jgi:hypothetical protein
MNNLFSIDDLFAQMFPWLSAISWDLGTILTSIIFLWFIVLAFDWVKEMLDQRISMNGYRKMSDNYFDNAKEEFQRRSKLTEGTLKWEESNMLYKQYLSESATLKVKSKGLKR